MRPSSKRQQAATYPRTRPVPIRFSDIDMFRHLNNVATGQFYEEARFELLAEARSAMPKEERGSALVVATVTTHFLSQARYPGEITVATGVLEIGARSFVIGQALFSEDRCIGTADITVVAVGADGACPVPQAVADYLRPLVIES